MKRNHQRSNFGNLAGCIVLIILVIGIGIVTLPLVILILVTYIPWLQPLGGQYAGSYYVEHINASTNTQDEDGYIHLWKCDTPIDGQLYRYSLKDGTSVLLAGEYLPVWDYVLEGDALYYEDYKGCHERDLVTKEDEQIPEDDPRYEKLQAEFEGNSFGGDTEEVYQMAEDALIRDGHEMSDVRASHFVWADGVYVGLAQVALNYRCAGGRLEQSELRYDILFSYDLTADRCEILYQSKNNRTRIIGYQNGNVYLYQRDRIFCKNLESGKQEILAWLPKSLTYTFDWWEDQLIVIDHETNELVEVLEI